jgi:hypothetical protein
MTARRQASILAQQLHVTVTVGFEQRGPDNDAEWCCTYYLKQNNNHYPPTVVPGQEWRRSKDEAKEQTAQVALVVLRAWDPRGRSVSSCPGIPLLIL